MSKNLDVKKQVVSDIVEKLQKAQSLVIVDYNGLTVEQATALRAQARANNVEYCVLKNTLVRRALNEIGVNGLDEVLNGPSAFAFGMEDPVSAARIIDEFISKNKTEALKIKAGLMGNDIMDANQVKALAGVPTREVLLSRLLGSLQSPISGLVRVLDAIAKKDAEPAAEAPAEA